jgi:ribosome-associated heat shock protein Hsp15
MTTGSEQALRVDRWLWYVRFFKTRALASTAVNGGHVRINGRRARPASKVRAGDSIEIVRNQLGYDIEVVTLPSRRGPATEVQETYRESEESLRRRRETIDRIRSDRMQMPRTAGKPDKRTRRKLRSRNRRQV